MLIEDGERERERKKERGRERETKGERDGENTEKCFIISLFFLPLSLPLSYPPSLSFLSLFSMSLSFLDMTHFIQKELCFMKFCIFSLFKI